MKPISPSAISKWRECQRAWAYRAIDGIKSTDNKHTALGSNVHRILAEYYKGGPRPDASTHEGRIALTALEHVPAPHPEMCVENHITAKTYAADYHGYIDLSYLSDDGTRVVVDYKTCGDFRWIKTPETLATDPQALIYALHWLQVHDVSKVELRWVFLKTRPSHTSRRVSLTVVKDQVLETLAVVADPYAKEIIDARSTVKRANELPRNPEACDRFGGCPYKAVCWSDHNKESTMLTLKQKMERLKAEREGRTATPDGPGDVVALNPPESALVPEKDPPPTAVEVPSVPVVEAPATTVPKKRGRPRKTPLAVELPAPLTVVVESPDAEVTLDGVRVSGPSTFVVPRDLPVLRPIEPTGTTVYVNALPIKPAVPYVLGSELVERAHKVVRERCNVRDARLVDYGKGGGELAAELAVILAGLEGTAIHVDTRDRLQADCLSVFLAAATSVVRGV